MTLRALLSLLALCALPVLATAGDVPDIINPNFPRQGLCIYVGAGKDPLFADLAKNTTLLIHGLAADDATFDAARQQIANAELFGRVTVEKIPIKPLPYVRDLADMMIIDDLTALSAKGLSMEEANRVLAPAVPCWSEKTVSGLEPSNHARRKWTNGRTPCMARTATWSPRTKPFSFRSVFGF